MNYHTKSPVLIIIFNRLDTVKRVLEAVSKVEPKKLYIASDCWRDGKVDRGGALEEVKVKECREFVLNNISWDCEVKTKFATENLGCQMGPYSAIKWFFENEAEGIILEDDILPNISFFRFCDELLEKYKDNKNISMISGYSFLDFDKPFKQSLKESYQFSKYNYIWGYASWARAWENYELYSPNWKEDFEKMHFDSKEEKKVWRKGFRIYFSGKLDAWDYPMTFCNWKHNMLCIYPKENMIQNIGIAHPDSTHTVYNSKFENMETYEIDFPLIHPKEIKRNVELDKVNFNIVSREPNIIIRIINKLARIIIKRNIIVNVCH